MKRFIILFALMGVMFTVSPSTAMAAHEGPVSATVTARLVSVGIAENNIGYGVLNTSDANNEPVGQNCATGVSAFTVTNNGNAEQDFNIKGAASISWALLTSAGSEQYAHRFSVVSGPCSFSEIATGDNTLKLDVAAGGTVETFLQMDMPTATTDTNEQTLEITITALAS